VVPVDTMKTWGTTGTATLTLTSALNGGEWSGSHTGRLTPEEPSPVPTGCAPTQPVSALRKRENLLSLLGIEIQILGCPGKVVVNDKWRLRGEGLNKN
jgi:hypothetical protein